MAPFGLANGSPPHGVASTNSRIDGGRRVPDAECIAGNVRPEIAYSKAAAQTATGGRAACFESPALPPIRSLGSKAVTFAVCFSCVFQPRWDRLS